ncbi:MAG TPA: MFS transporter [Polyangiaceae bacterium]|jgi:MFS family permease|nr:MFS transporter [Polyangiaceae bacterium]
MAESAPRAPRAALNYPDFRLFQLARFASVLGSQVVSIAVGWHVYDITRRPLDLGWVGLAQFIPAFLLSLPAGHVADRLDRRRIFATCLACYSVVALSLLALSAGAATTALPVYVVLVFFGAARGFSGPASQALLPDLVPKEDFASAIAWSSSVWQIGAIAGPAAGGFLYSLGGARLAYAVSAVLFLTGSVACALIRTRPARSTSRSQSLREVFAGVEYVFRKKIVLGAISLDLFAVLLGGATALLPVYARDILHVGPSGLGALRAAPGLGAAVMAIVLAHRPLGKRAGWTLYGCVGLFGVATIVFGASTSFSLSLGALVVLGAADLVSVVVRHTVVQLETPPEMRGRVSAVNMLFIGASNELGEFESGLTAELFGVVRSVIVGGVGSCLVVFVWAWLFPELRDVDRLDAPASP